MSSFRPSTSESTSHGSGHADADQLGVHERQSHLHSLRTLFDRLEGIHDLVENAKQDMHNLTNTQQPMQVKLLEDKIAELENALQSTTRVNSELVSKDRQLSAEIQYQQKELAKTRNELDKVETELSECNTRLSRHMSTKLTDNNPQIADLSDSNRPSKLGDKHSELYDNEWTDAFEELYNKYGDEQNAIKILIEILMNVNEFCKAKSVEQSRQLKQVACMRTTELDKVPETAEFKKQMKEFRKYTADLSIQAVCQDYALKTYTQNPDPFSNPKVRQYIEECVQLCWLMNAQDPRVAFAPAAAPNGSFDTDVYKHYTQSGSMVQYVVWPALLLHEGGALLMRGVAQGHTPVHRNRNRTSVHEERSYPSYRNSQWNSAYGSGNSAMNSFYNEIRDGGVEQARSSSHGSQRESYSYQYSAQQLQRAEDGNHQIDTEMKRGLSGPSHATNEGAQVDVLVKDLFNKVSMKKNLGDSMRRTPSDQPASRPQSSVDAVLRNSTNFPSKSETDRMLNNFDQKESLC